MDKDNIVLNNLEYKIPDNIRYEIDIIKIYEYAKSKNIERYVDSVIESPKLKTDLSNKSPRY